MTRDASPAGGAVSGAAITADLSDRELYLARSALGLQYGDRQQSYRNRFMIYGNTPDMDAWRAMVERGLAKVVWQFDLRPSTFWLTRAGAEAALRPGESLCPEDFPPEKRPTASPVLPAAARETML